MADVSLHYRTQAPLAGNFEVLGQVLATWRRRASERRELANLDARAIRDLGLSSGQIQFEASKPFWRR